MKKELKELLRRETTYHSDGGTSGYKLSEEEYENITQSLIDMVSEKIDGMTIIATDDFQFRLHTDGYNNAIEDIINSLKQG